MVVSLETRVARLEAQNRFLRGALIVLAMACGLAAAGAAAAASGAIEASRFVVKDGRGRTRAVLGEEALTIYGPDGQVVAELGTGPRAYPIKP
jgi:hypothetical protein